MHMPRAGQLALVHPADIDSGAAAQHELVSEVLGALVVLGEEQAGGASEAAGGVKLSDNPGHGIDRSDAETVRGGRVVPPDLVGEVRERDIEFVLNEGR
jgi:hypothetical protein